jgi:hypothetical protein
VRFQTTLKRAAAYAAMLFLCTALSARAQMGSQGDSGSRDSSMNSQRGAAPSSNSGMTNQGGGDDATLEISPQPGIKPPGGSSDEIPTHREFKPGEDTADINRNFKPDDRELNGNRPSDANSKSCLGIHVSYTSYCFKGGEEHGLEVTAIDHNSPAQKAGLKAADSSAHTAIAAAEVASAVIPFAQMITNHMLEKAAMSRRGDLIVAVDDVRVRNEADLYDQLRKLRPGDTVYLTVIRPLPGGNDHTQLKIAVQVGNWQPGSADSCGEFTASSQPAR